MGSTTIKVLKLTNSLFEATLIHNIATNFHKTFMIISIRIHQRTIKIHKIYQASNRIHNKKSHNNDQKNSLQTNTIHNQDNTIHKNKFN